jgi:hypothetical protein
LEDAEQYTQKLKYDYAAEKQFTNQSPYSGRLPVDSSATLCEPRKKSKALSLEVQRFEEERALEFGSTSFLHSWSKWNLCREKDDFILTSGRCAISGCSDSLVKQEVRKVSPIPLNPFGCCISMSIGILFALQDPSQHLGYIQQVGRKSQQQKTRKNGRGKGENSVHYQQEKAQKTSKGKGECGIHSWHETSELCSFLS